MACNSNTEIENDNESLKSSGNTSENCNDKKQLLSDSISATSRQNGEQAGCEDEQMSEQDASERRKSGMMDFKTNSASPSTLQRPAEELPRRNFQIPRKIKEKKGLFQNLSPEAREFDELIKLLSSFYLEPNSRGTFTYTKARLIHNELLEKEFIEKKRELRQNGRSDAELEETYGFLLPDKDKVQTICEKGLSVGHSRVNTLGSPAKGVYLSRYSDLLQMNPFEPGTTGDIIVFKIMKGKLKTIYETGPKNIVDPTQKFDCHVSKNGSKVASLYSYRAFEHTQQYLFEFAFEELKSRPRHVYPYAVLSFQYRGRDTGPSLNRLNHPLTDSSRGTRASRRRYTVWSGTLVNKGEELFQISVRSSNLPLLPFRLPDRLDISTAMNLDEMKKKLPALLSWDTFYGKREVLKYGMYCSLFEVVSRSKPGNHNLPGLLQKLERDKIVLVKPLLDKGFLFLISSTQMQISNERRNRMEKGLHALFIFQDPRLITRFSTTCAAPPPRDPADGVVLRRLEPFLPALHHALLRLRAHPPKDLSIAVERQATDYLSQLRDRSRGPPQPFRLPEYRQHLDERPGYPAGPRPRFSTDTLRSYLHAPATYQLQTAKAHSLLSGEGLAQRRRPPPPPSASTTSTSSSAATAAAGSSTVSPAPSPMGGAEDEHSPVSDWGSQERVAAPATVSASGTARAAQSNGGSQRAALRASLGLGGGGGREGRGPQYERDKMEKLLQLIHMHKRTLVEEREDNDDGWAWDAVGLKRRLEDGGSGQASKYLRTGLLSNGEPGRASCSEEAGSDDSQSLSLSMVMDSIGICDTDLRERMSQSGGSSGSGGGGGGGGGGDPSVQETHRLLKLLMSMLNRAIVPGATGAAELAAETLERVSAEAMGLGLDPVRSETSDLDLRARAKEDEPPPATQDYLEEQTACSMSSMDVCSPASPGEPMQLSQPPPSASAPSSSSVAPDLWSHPDKAPLPVVPDHLAAPVAAAAAMSDPSTLCQSLDAIIQDEFQSLSSHIKHLMDGQAIMYAPPASAKRPDARAHTLRPGACFSTFVSRHVKPPPIQSYMNTLRDRMGHVVSQPWTAHPKPHPSVPSSSVYGEHAGVPSTVPSSAAQTFPFAPAPTYAPSPGTVTVSPASTAAVPSSGLPPPGPVSAAPPLVTAVHLSPITPPQATPSPAASIASEAAAPSSSLGPAAAVATVTTPVSSFTPPPAKSADSAPRKKSSSSSSSRHHHRTKDSRKSESKSTSSSEGSSTPLTVAALAAHQQQLKEQAASDAAAASASSFAVAVAHPTDSKSAANSLISQIKPDIFLSLVQMVQKNTLKFYIHVSEEDGQNQLCTEIKDYLKSFGNVECNPQSFLENNNTLDKFLVIIQNEDIAMHVDKIPALVSLKKLPSVSFAGVDSLDDVKNRTYNELFVSGGLIVSDELILNPELMTLDKLQRLLKFLEDQSSIWQWKVHCKTQKKLKELSRLNSDTMNMLNLLTSYQKKHLVEFLPYHECDAPTRMAPDLECLTKLQASHTQHRHIIFLTALPGKRKHEMWPQFSNRGIIVAAMEEVLEDFTGILSYTPDKMDQPTPTPAAPAPPTAPPPSAAEKDSGANDECVQEEDMSLDSEDETTAISQPDAATSTTSTTTTTTAATTASNSTNDQPLPAPSSIQPPPPPQVQDFQPPIPPLPEMPPIPDMPPLPDAMAPQSSPMSYGSSSSSKIDFPSSSSSAAFASSASSAPELVADSLASSFGVNPHQSYLCPGPSQWSPFSGFSLPSQPSPVCTPYPHQSPTAPHASQPPAPPPEELSSVDVTPVVPPPLPDTEANSMGVPPTPTTAPLVSQNAQDGGQETQGTAMEPALVSYPIKSVMDPALVSYPIKPSMEPVGLPSLPPEPTIPPPPPGLHLAYGCYGWGGDMTQQHQQYGHMGDMSLAGMDVGMAELTDGTGTTPAAAESMWAVGDPSGLNMNMSMPMSVSATPPGTPYLHSGGAMGSPMAEKNGGLTPANSVGPNSQCTRTPLSSGPESHHSPGAPAGRGGPGPRTLLSPPGSGMGPQGRGGGGGGVPRPPLHGNHMGSGGYNNRGGMSGPQGSGPQSMDMGMRGGFRGRAAPPMPRAMTRPPAPMRGHMRGGPQSSWGAPVRGIPPAPHQLQDYYSDYGYH